MLARQAKWEEQRREEIRPAAKIALTSGVITQNDELMNFLMLFVVANFKNMSTNICRISEIYLDIPRKNSINLSNSRISLKFGGKSAAMSAISERNQQNVWIYFNWTKMSYIDNIVQKNDEQIADF